LAPELEAKGILAKVDGGILAAYCSALARLYYSEKDIEKHGAYQTGEFGIKRHPAVLSAKESRDQIRALGSELGVTAASRARIKATPKDKDKPQGARRFLA
jgi:P27 family predicted phage terminase small subunit